jgi:LacI family transcriptional regulator
MVTRNDVARLAGVSPALVSYVLNNGPRPVSEKTRARVLKAIRELDYQPSAVARNLRLQRTSTLGLILPDIQNPYFSEVTRGVEWIAFENNYTVILCHSGYSLERELQYVNALRIQRVAGVIWIPATANLEPYNRLVKFGVPTVLLDRGIPGQNVKSVGADNFRGGYLATQHLIQLGHRRIGAISRPVDLSHSQERIQGYLAALREAGLSIDERLISPGGYWLENGRKAFERLIALEDPPTALFTYNDIMAIGALRAAHQHGLKIPDDFSIVGFDNIPEADFTSPALTTISQPKFDMGRTGTELLLRSISGESSSVESLPPLDVSLIVRESTGKAPAKGRAG